MTKPYDLNKLLPPEPFQIMNHSDSTFFRLGKRYLNLFINGLGLKPDSKVLEIGSGNARIAHSMVNYITEGSFMGVDVMKPFIDWCKEAYKDIPYFSFEHIDVSNPYYNTSKSQQPEDFKFDLPDDSYDLIYLTSVFTHIRSKGVENYLKEIKRLLSPNGKCLASYFIIDEETKALMDEGKSRRVFLPFDEHSYVITHQIPEAAIAYNKEYLLKVYLDLGFKIESVSLGMWRDFENPDLRKNFMQDQIIVSG